MFGGEKLDNVSEICSNFVAFILATYYFFLNLYEAFVCLYTMIIAIWLWFAVLFHDIVILSD